jgi:low affinity Fe/Cu permease
MANGKASTPNFMERFSRSATQWTGSSWAFGIALSIILLWIASGPIFGYSDTWQLVINTSTTIVTFLMVFLIQRSQNKDAQAMHLKLNEIVATLHGASNRLIDVEDLSEHELATLHQFYERLAERAKKEGHLASSHSLGEADEAHERKGKKLSKGAAQ